MDEVGKPINSVCYTPSSEPYRIYSIVCLGILKTSRYREIYSFGAQREDLSHIHLQ
jgi:hypothetical protein